jgi:hypothetical protein
MLSIHLRLGLPSGLFPSGFPTNNLYTFLFYLFKMLRESAILILHCVTSRLEVAINFICSSMQVSITVLCKINNFVFQILPHFILDMSAGFIAHIVQIAPICIVLG